MRFTRHAKNKPQYTGEIRGVRVRVVVALDELDLIVTIHKRRCLTSSGYSGI